MDCSPPGSSVHGILQARILEWVAISFSRESFWSRDHTQVSRIADRHFNLWATREAQEDSITPLPLCKTTLSIWDVSSSSGGAWPSLSSCSGRPQCACGQAISLQPLYSLMASTSPTSRPFHFSHLHTGPFARPAPPKTASNSLTTAAHLSSSLMSLMGLNLIFHLIESSGTLVSPLSHRLSAPHGLIFFLAWADALINGPKHSFINSSPIAPSLPGRTAGLDTSQYLPSAPRPLLKLTRSHHKTWGLGAQIPGLQPHIHL